MKAKEKIFEMLFLLAAGFSIIAVFMICLFLFANSIPAIHKIGFVEFIFGQKWKPGNELYGIFPMIIGVTVGSLILMKVIKKLLLYTAIYYIIQLIV